MPSGELVTGEDGQDVRTIRPAGGASTACAGGGGAGERHASAVARAGPPGAPHGHPLPPTTVWLLDAPECPAYDRFVARHPAGTLYHTLAWRDALLGRRAGQAVYLVAMRGDEVVGVLPAFEAGGGADGRRLVSLPHTPAGGLLVRDDAAADVLRSRAMELAERRGATGFFIRRFVPASAPRRAGASPGWLCVSVADLLERAGGGGSPAGVRFDDQELGAGACGGPWRWDRGWLPAPLPPAWSALNPLHLTFARSWAGVAPPAAAWLSFGRHAHVLAWQAGGSRAAFWALLRDVAGRAAGGGATRIDFPLDHGATADLPWRKPGVPVAVSGEAPLLSAPMAPPPRPR